ncbi:hypothetical protein ACIBSW_29520 [Actinoplanes sp. NPDC049668]|uniref:hypothetical protein n=1 Tax=unclassified Actinoplanes TaxID=2626549 RepID=UPI0033B6721E
MLGFLGSLPQALLAMLLLLQGRGLTGSDAETHSELGLFAAAVFLFWWLVGCGVLALWIRASPLAAALARGALAGFVSCCRRFRILIAVWYRQRTRRRSRRARARSTRQCVNVIMAWAIRRGYGR